MILYPDIYLTNVKEALDYIFKLKTILSNLFIFLRMNKVIHHFLAFYLQILISTNFKKR